MDQVQVYSNLKYSGVDPTRLLMDVYVPTDSTSNEPRPVMILIHGGAGQRPGMLTPTGLASVCVVDRRPLDRRPVARTAHLRQKGVTLNFVWLSSSR